MLKVVIADDEARILSLIRLLPDWDALGMEVAGAASNGLEALEMVEREKPDILITDIRMPGCQGLELIERARRAVPGLEIIIISGYAHFEYAQTAIKLGVGDYLLKPIKKDELTSTLDKLARRCRAKHPSRPGAEAQERGRAQAALWEKLVREAASGRAFPNALSDLEAAYGFGLSDGVFRAFVLKLDFQNLGREPLEIIHGKARELLSPLLSMPGTQLACAHDEDRVTGVLCAFPGAQEGARRALRQALNQLEAQRGLLGPVTFSLSLSAVQASPAQIPTLVREASLLIDERLLEGTGRLLEGEIMPSGLRDARLLERYGHELEKALSTLDTEQAVACTNALAREAMGFPGVRGHELTELVRSAGSLFALRLGLEGEDEAAFVRQAGLSSRADELFECLIQFEKQHMEAEDIRRRSEALRPIRIARQYVQEHYSESITLEDVCAATGFSVSYFSALFKKESGEGFSKYLTGVRMERAKELLQESSLPVSEVCEKVGYSDLKHFTQTFKKYTSLSPAQYRKLYG